jgi:16S rRNA (guanine966-N2)-methyltransferase
VTGTAFLDLFAGSGSVGLEAWSRGAGCVWWVESGRRVLRCLNDNIKNLCREELLLSGQRLCVSVYQGDALRFLKKDVADRQFDIIFADPPYEGKRGTRNAERGTSRRSLDGILRAIDSGGVLAEGGIFVMEQAVETDVPTIGNWLVTNEKVYGGTKLIFLKKEPSQ